MRGRSGVQLTTEGELLLPYIRTVLHDQRRLSERIGEINGLREGLIRVGTFNSVSSQWLPGMIKRFQAQYPAIRLSCSTEQIPRLPAGLPTAVWIWALWPIRPGRSFLRIFCTGIRSSAFLQKTIPILPWKLFRFQNLRAAVYCAQRMG